ncbi:MAG TPA: zinc ribbon domain-containing protein, partial [Rhodopila sp.]
MSYLPKGLPEPVTETDKLDLPYWQGSRAGKLMVQRCGKCSTWQWGPEWICHECRSWDMKWVEVEGRGAIWTWTRCWHPVHPALKGAG